MMDHTGVGSAWILPLTTNPSEVSTKPKELGFTEVQVYIFRGKRLEKDFRLSEPCFSWIVGQFVHVWTRCWSLFAVGRSHV